MLAHTRLVRRFLLRLRSPQHLSHEISLCSNGLVASWWFWLAAGSVSNDVSQLMLHCCQNVDFCLRRICCSRHAPGELHLFTPTSACFATGIRLTSCLLDLLS